jgi:hypothetical protein
MQINPPIALAFTRQRCLLQSRTCLARVNIKYNSSHGFAVLVHLATIRYIYKYFRVILKETGLEHQIYFTRYFASTDHEILGGFFYFVLLLNISKIGDNLLKYCSEISRNKIGDIQPANQVFARKEWKVIRLKACFQREIFWIQFKQKLISQYNFHKILHLAKLHKYGTGPDYPDSRKSKQILKRKKCVFRSWDTSSRDFEPANSRLWISVLDSYVF